MLAQSRVRRTIENDAGLDARSHQGYEFTSSAFYPIDGLGWDAPAPGPNAGQTGTDCAGRTGHNFSFTSELHYPFTYSSATSPTFDFTGDDDVYGFINGQLVIDLGGVHGMANENVTLTPAEATTLGMTDGGWYSIDLFQAERHTCGSDYTLTIGGFTHVISQCVTVCGDGIVAGRAKDSAMMNSNFSRPCETSNATTKLGSIEDDSSPARFAIRSMDPERYSTDRRTRPCAKFRQEAGLVA
jgi:fibro-slime domain-containing protein